MERTVLVLSVLYRVLLVCARSLVGLMCRAGVMMIGFLDDRKVERVEGGEWLVV